VEVAGPIWSGSVVPALDERPDLGAIALRVWDQANLIVDGSSGAVRVAWDGP